MDNLDMECHDAVQEQNLKHICEMLEKLLEVRKREENRMLEKGKEIEQKIFEWNELQRKHTSFAVNEKAILENLRLYCSSLGNKKQKSRTDSDPPYLNERSSVPGFTFQPNDDQIFGHLKEKHSNPCQTSSGSPIKDCIHLYRTEPRHLPGADSIIKKKALYFYVRTKKKSENGDRVGPKGFWRAGSCKTFFETEPERGYRRTLKYFEYPGDKNRKFSKHGKPTNWIMHEYRLASANSQTQEELSHWTICKITLIEKNIKVPNDFSKEGSIDSLPMEVQPNSTSPAPKQLDNNDLEMHMQNEAQLQVERLIQEKAGDQSRQQIMNGVIDPFEEVTPCYASGIHSTPSMMVTMHEVETRGVEPQQFENSGKITEEIEPTSVPRQISEEYIDFYPNRRASSGVEDENQSRLISEQIASWEGTPSYASEIHSTPSRVLTTTPLDPILSSKWTPPPSSLFKVNCDAAWLEQSQQFENLGKFTKEFGPSISGQTSDCFLNSDFFIGREHENESLSYQLPIAETTRMEDDNQLRFDHLPVTDLSGMEDENLAVQLHFWDNPKFI